MSFIKVCCVHGSSQLWAENEWEWLIGWVEEYGNAHRELALWGFGVMHFTESEQK